LILEVEKLIEVIMLIAGIQVDGLTS
jgi:hypothetical protein